MILTKLTVSGFGKLKGYSTTFDKELNTFVFENGWGKTTLSDFIYAMFYGLAQTTKKKLTENLRKKYQPWDNGTFGGSIDFIHNGKKYSIERTFGSTAKDDTFKLIDLETNKTYRSTGGDNASYAEISSQIALGETSSTAYAGNKGKANADAIGVLQEQMQNHKHTIHDVEGIVTIAVFG